MPTYPYSLTITNPGAESGTTGWTNSTGTLSSDTAGTHPAHSGTHYFRAGASASTYAYQDVAVPSDAQSDVDAGLLAITFAGWHAAGDSSDKGYLTLKFYDGSMTQLGGERAMPSFHPTLDVYGQRKLTVLVPPNTRTIRIGQRGDRVSGTNLDSLWDDLTLDLIEAGVGRGVVGCDLWIKSADLSGVDGDPVSAWTDQSGMANDLSGSGTTRPLYRPSGTLGLNSKPTAEADGTDDILTLASSDQLCYVGYPGFTVIAVIEHNFSLGSTGNGDIVGRDGSSGGRGWRLTLTDKLFFQVASSPTARTQRNGNVVNARGMPMVVRARYDGAAGEMSIWVNGVLDNGSIDASVPTTLGGNGTSFGVFGSGAGFRFKGNIPELLVFGRAISDADAEYIESQLFDEYQLYVLEETDTSPDTDSHQGLDTDGTYEYTIHTNKIYKRDASDWSEILSNASPFSGLAGVQHLTDGACAGGALYVEMDNYPTAGGGLYIARFDLTDLSRIDVTDISGDISGTVTGIGVDIGNGIIYGIGLDDSNLMLHSWSLSDLSFIQSQILSYGGYNTQGITYRDGLLWVCFGDDATATGLIALIDPNDLSVRPIYRRYIAGGDYAEGVSCTASAFRWMIDVGTTTQTVHVYSISGAGAPPPPSSLGRSFVAGMIG